jgi:15-cis-phytoene synthase
LSSNAPHAVSAAYLAADQALASKGRSFHWARRLLDTKHASRSTRLYGFCRRIDDLVDESPSVDVATIALATLTESLRAGHSDNALFTDAIALLNECQIDTAIPLELIAGVKSDLSLVRIADEAELLRYCYRVAGTVGLMMSAVLDVDNEAALPHAIDLGIAMQLTNICRDVRTDALMNRRYLPTTLVGDVTLDALVQPNAAEQRNLRNAVEYLLDLADVYYASGERGLVYLPPGARRGMLVAARVYRAIGTQLRARDFDYWSSRAMVSTPEKAAITLIALTGAVVRRVRGRPHVTHDPVLHRALVGLPWVDARASDPNAN